MRALEALAITIPLFVLLFASTYVVMAALSARSFSQPMNHTNALYFTVTVFATVGSAISPPPLPRPGWWSPDR